MLMHGWRAGEAERKREGRHMWTVPTLASVAGDGSCSSSSLANSFCKDGRKISVGDCALFKPPQDSPPFIGIIRSLTSGNENKLKLCVNWLYRPTEVKLGRGIRLEAVPNEIFYSFHKDEIPAASLLHPCKVAFLPKGVELPSGICSFVCRRVYDIKNRSLWWLTDKDYINERQEEVDQLLQQTRVEMHVTVQQGGRSPKPMNGPTSASQLKPGSDSVHNSLSSFTSQGKGKKRERGYQGSEPVKRERSTKIDDEDSGHGRPENILRSEIIKITDKGGLVDFEGVEKLVQLMVPDRNERKKDLVCRSMLASVVAATDKFDCLSKFVQLRGLPVFDEWLQEVHKGKISDGSNLKDGDKAIEEFLLVSLRALDKLPVNLHALQMCNIGKSVNHLRTHKNLEIQKKARSLVDTWKKRVEAEMDAKSGSDQAVSWPARPCIPEVSHGGNKNSGASSDTAIKSSTMQLSTSKTASVKLVQGETRAKYASLSPGSTKSAVSPASGSINLKDGLQRNNSVGGTFDLPSTPARDEESSSSSQSHNNSQSCPSDPDKTGGFSGKEDMRSSTAGSLTVNKISGGSSRPQKSANGFPDTAHRSSRNSTSHKNSASEKLSQSSLTCEKVVDMPVVEGNSHKLIVKLPNRGRSSPAQSACGDEPSVMISRDSSPVLLDKHDQFDYDLKGKCDVYRPNVTSDVKHESWQSNDFKDALTGGSYEGDGSSETVPDEEHSRIGDETRKMAEVSKAASTSSGNEMKSGKLHEVSFSSINALIDSFAKFSESKASVPVGNDAGMNLLASVAAGEMSKSDLVSPVSSPQRTPVREPVCDNFNSRMKSFPGDHSGDSADDEHGELGANRILWTKNTDSNEEKPGGDLTGDISTSSRDLQQIGDPCQENIEDSKEIVMAEDTLDGAGKSYKEVKGSFKEEADGTLDAKQKIIDTLSTEDKVSDSTQGVECKAADSSLISHRSLGFEDENKKDANEGLNNNMKTEQKLPPITTHPENVNGTDRELLHTSGPCEVMASENIDEVKAEKVEFKSHVNQCKEQKSEWKTNAHMLNDDQAIRHVGSAHIEGKGGHMEENLECTVPREASSGLRVQENGQHVRTGAPKSTASEGEKAQEFTSTTVDASCSAAGASDMEAKVGFDLNEGFDGEDRNDGKYGNSCSFAAPGRLVPVQQLINSLPLPVSSGSSSLPASITVAAAAKGPFVLPENLLRSKGALGWKGSAATSAFRPAEPRKMLDLPLGNISVPDATPVKHSRPLLDIDLNVPDERVLEDLASQSSARETVSMYDYTNNRAGSSYEVKGTTSVRSSVGLDLDLNRAEELVDVHNHLTRNEYNKPVPLHDGISSSSLSNAEVSVYRDFDLNDGPVVDETCTIPSVFHQNLRNVPSQAPVSGLRMSHAETRNFSSWFPRGNTYSPITVPSFFPDRGELPFPVVASGASQRMLAPPTSGFPFGPDVFRGPVLSSSPAVPFSSTPFQYPVFPFGTSFPLPSATFSVGSTSYIDSSSGGRLCFPDVNSQLMGSAGAVPSHYSRPCVVSLPDGSNSASPESSLKWGRQGLDLNAGPGIQVEEVRDETLPFVPRKLSVAGMQVQMEDQARMYRMAGGHLKRKEPEGGWDGYKRTSWQ